MQQQVQNPDIYSTHYVPPPPQGTVNAYTPPINYPGSQYQNWMSPRATYRPYVPPSMPYTHDYSNSYRK